jgi:N6-L-threonylcarbamoyladenine synthase
MNILAIESSCDETAAAVVRDGKTVLGCSIASQIPIHRRFGGVVPEVASRAHLEQITTVVSECLEDAKLTLSDVDAIAATVGPGLLGSLMVGAHFARGLASASGKPFIPVNHLEGHLAANFIDRNPDEVPYPALGLVVSGGHTLIVSIPKPGTYELVGQTLDDAAGEAFDKVAQLLSLPYPGGPEIEKAASTGKSTDFSFPRAITTQTERKAKNYNLSFSGLKTAVSLTFQHSRQGSANSIAAAFQEAVVDALRIKLSWAIEDKQPKSLLAGGGVVANASVKRMLQELGNKYDIPIFIPPMKLCTDNAIVIGAAAFHHQPLTDSQPLSLDPNLPLATA